MTQIKVDREAIKSNLKWQVRSLYVVAIVLFLVGVSPVFISAVPEVAMFPFWITGFVTMLHGINVERHGQTVLWICDLLDLHGNHTNILKGNVELHKSTTDMLGMLADRGKLETNAREMMRQ